MTKPHLKYFDFEEAVSCQGTENKEETLLELLKEGGIRAEGRLFDPDINAHYQQGDINLCIKSHEPIPQAYWIDWDFHTQDKSLRSPNDQSRYTSIRIKKTELSQNKGGRPPQYDWGEFYIELAAYIEAYDNISENSINAEKIEILRNNMDWFRMKTDGGPESDDIKDRIKKFTITYKKHLDRFKKIRKT